MNVAVYFFGIRLLLLYPLSSSLANHNETNDAKNERFSTRQKSKPKLCGVKRSSCNTALLVLLSVLLSSPFTSFHSPF